MRRIPFATCFEANREASAYLYTLIETNNITETSWLIVFDSAWEKSNYWHAVSGTTDASEPF